MKELLSLKNSKKGLVIHHWDTDGLCSAALLARFFSKHLSQIKLDFLTPTINNYYLLPTEVESIEKANYNFIVTCDINFSEKEIKNLSSICPTKVFVFDHHKQTPYKEVFYYNKPYPSCSLVIVEYLQQKIDLLTSLGAIGDKEEKIKKEQQYWPIIQKKLEKDNITLAEALHMRNLLDSCYMTNDYYSLNEAISILQDDPLIILQDINLRNNLTKINTAVAEAKIGRASCRERV